MLNIKYKYIYNILKIICNKSRIKTCDFFYMLLYVIYVNIFDNFIKIVLQFLLQYFPLYLVSLIDLTFYCY